MAFMPQRKRMVKFEPIALKAAVPGWYVRVTLPRGEQIQINEFETETEAKNWITGKSAAWLKKIEAGGTLRFLSPPGPASYILCEGRD
jgi:hypothetical protein